MTLPDPSLDRPAPDAGNVQDRLPATERGEDPARDAVTHELVNDPARPLTDAERQAAEHDIPRPERVYAPASERVPKEPLPGHRDVVEHEDPSTPQRQHASEAPSAAWTAPASGGGSAGYTSPASTGASASYTTPSSTGAGAAYSTPASTSSAYAPPASMPSAYAPSSPSAAAPEGDDEPSFTRVARPSQTATVTTPTPSPYASVETNPGFGTSPELDADWTSSVRPWAWTFGWVALAAGSALGVWLYLRWQRERNKPINRLRRQARQAATELRDRVPSSDEVVSPSLGVLAALASTALVLIRRLQGQGKRPTQAAKHTAQTISDADWQKRLIQLKERWTPHRLELEKVSISRH